MAIAAAFRCSRGAKNTVIVKDSSTRPESCIIYTGPGNFDATDVSELIAMIMGGSKGRKHLIRAPFDELVKNYTSKGMRRLF